VRNTDKRLNAITRTDRHVTPRQSHESGNGWQARKQSSARNLPLRYYVQSFQNYLQDGRYMVRVSIREQCVLTEFFMICTHSPYTTAGASI
jgi:hypothetical protein